MRQAFAHRRQALPLDTMFRQAKYLRNSCAFRFRLGCRQDINLAAVYAHQFKQMFQMKLWMHFNIAAAAKALRVVGGGRQVIPAFVGQGKVDTRQDDVPIRHQRHTAQHARHGFGGCGYANRYYRAFNHILRKSPFQRCKQMVPTFCGAHEFARGQRRMICRQNQQKLTISALPMARQVCVDRDVLYLGKIDQINLKLVNQVRQFAR